VAGARPSLSLTIGAAVVTCLVTGGVLLVPTIASCRSAPEGLAACLQSKVEQTRHTIVPPVAPEPNVVPSVIADVTPDPSGVLEATVSSEPLAPVPAIDLIAPHGSVIVEGDVPPQPVEAVTTIAAPSGILDADGAITPAPAPTLVAIAAPGGELTASGAIDLSTFGWSLAELQQRLKGIIEADVSPVQPTVTTVALLEPEGSIFADGNFTTAPPLGVPVELHGPKGILSANVVALPPAPPLVAELTVGPGAIEADGATLGIIDNSLVTLTANIPTLPAITWEMFMGERQGAVVTLEANLPTDTPSYASVIRLGPPPPLQPSIVLLPRETSSFPNVTALPAPSRSDSLVTLQLH
jgi:hypothetical protein